MFKNISLIVSHAQAHLRLENVFRPIFLCLAYLNLVTFNEASTTLRGHTEIDSLQALSTKSMSGVIDPDTDTRINPLTPRTITFALPSFMAIPGTAVPPPQSICLRAGQAFGSLHCGHLQPSLSDPTLQTHRGIRETLLKGFICWLSEPPCKAQWGGSLAFHVCLS